MDTQIVVMFISLQFRVRQKSILSTRIVPLLGSVTVLISLLIELLRL